jgi:hypothetical protein
VAVLAGESSPLVAAVVAADGAVCAVVAICDKLGAPVRRVRVGLAVELGWATGFATA